MVFVWRNKNERRKDKIEKSWQDQKYILLDSGCGSVGWVVASDTFVSRFESSHWQMLLTINCIEKTKIKETEAGNGP